MARAMDGYDIATGMAQQGVKLPDDIVSIDTHIDVADSVHITYTCLASKDVLLAMARAMAAMTLAWGEGKEAGNEH